MAALATNPKVAAVAVLGKDNNPLYIHAFGPKGSPLTHDEQMRHHLIVHTAIDYVEESMDSDAC